MATLADFFNPTIFMFLGILVLVVALIVVYFESKIRDQNHKIASMLSLVSTLAEDMNGVKMGLHQLAITRIGGSTSQNFQQPLENHIITQPNKLIDVSDDEEEDDDDEEDEDEDSDEEDENSDEEDDDNDIDEDIDENIDEDTDEDNDSDSGDKEHETFLETIEDGGDDKPDYIKVLKINMKQNTDYDELSESNNLVLESLDDLDDESSCHKLSSTELNNNSKLEPRDFSSETVEEKVNDDLDISSSIFKSIKINLEDSYTDSLDYKKLPLPKLRSIVSEKGLVTDTSRLKKNELLKLLGVE
jgi:hypothetical protein